MREIKVLEDTDEIEILLREFRSLSEKLQFLALKLQTLFINKGKTIRLVDLQSEPPDSFYS